MNSKHSKSLRTIRARLEKSGERALGAEAVIRPVTEVRRAGLKRLSGRAVKSVIFATGLAASGMVINNALAREDDALREIVEARRHELSHNPPKPTIQPITHSVEPGENPWTIARLYTTDPHDTLDLTQEIETQLADDNGKIHPGQIAEISPDPIPGPNRNR